MESVVVRFRSADQLEAELEQNGYAGCFAPGEFDLVDGQECELVLVPPAGASLTVMARAVYIRAGSSPGVGFAFIDAPTMREYLEELVSEARSEARADDAGAAEYDDDGADDDGDGARDMTRLERAAALARANRGDGEIAKNMHARLRGLSPAEQARVARGGDVNARVVLERIYGKAVWEALLQNPRLTHPEVARLARMGSLPRPQLEIIVANNHWINNARVRRALLSNRRMTPAMVLKVLRAMPKHELKMMPKQTAYPPAVRDTARRLLLGETA